MYFLRRTRTYTAKMYWTRACARGVVAKHPLPYGIGRIPLDTLPSWDVLDWSPITRSNFDRAPIQSGDGQPPPPPLPPAILGRLQVKPFHSRVSTLFVPGYVHVPWEVWLYHCATKVHSQPLTVVLGGSTGVAVQSALGKHGWSHD